MGTTLKKLFVIIVLAISGLCSPAYAERTARNSHGGAVTLHDTECVDPVAISKIKPEMLGKFKASTTSVPGRSIPGCWIQVDGDVVIVDNDGDIYAWPATAFGISSF